ncbi:MAG: transcription antitermination factor NusB [Nocardioidaceae bacterium]
MGARTKARKRALDILFESELRGLPTGATLQERRDTIATMNHYTITLVEGVVAHRDEIDRLLGSYSTDWPLERMPGVDRNLLRIGVFELRYVDEVPAAVAMSEAVSLAKELSTDESSAFVNGLLAKIAGLNPIELDQQQATIEEEQS